MSSPTLHTTLGAHVYHEDVSHNGTILIIDERNLVSECIAHCVRTQRPHNQIINYTSILDCVASASGENDEALILFSIGSGAVCSETFLTALDNLSEAFPGAPIIIIADSEDATQILKSLDCGVRGYIPTSASLNVALEAINLVEVGGTFIPASSLTSSRKSILGRSDRRIFDIEQTFTARQAAVVEALRQGKANKIIAYELNMRESTVKVHVRNIMKKLRAKNRTEVAYITNSYVNSMI
ncbi:LuxR C-terminal-related transcriptional regulator [Hansschlegelia quercus]|uniref:Response regulator transcription factor n=1 Tax=Hansschlegelia quercus TaxID=2528245 RepID=A0A4Q9G979_9HYPH|nr:response regulator transcription factor [Hansschlegelia quercus]TBN47313.1 response regulator transcription factor [Hansschlegelia quercus]